MYYSGLRWKHRKIAHDVYGASMIIADLVVLSSRSRSTDGEVPFSHFTGPGESLRCTPDVAQAYQMTLVKSLRSQKCVAAARCQADRHTTAPYAYKTDSSGIIKPETGLDPILRDEAPVRCQNVWVYHTRNAQYPLDCTKPLNRQAAHSIIERMRSALGDTRRPLRGFDRTTGDCILINTRRVSTCCSGSSCSC